MARPLRIEFAGALYHVTSRGDGREAIYAGKNDREIRLELLGQVCERFNWAIQAYCKMSRVVGRAQTNHFDVLWDHHEDVLCAELTSATPFPRLLCRTQGHSGHS